MSNNIADLENAIDLMCVHKIVDIEFTKKYNFFFTIQDGRKIFIKNDKLTHFLVDLCNTDSTDPIKVYNLRCISNMIGKYGKMIKKMIKDKMIKKNN